MGFLSPTRRHGQGSAGLAAQARVWAQLGPYGVYMGHLRGELAQGCLAAGRAVLSLRVSLPALWRAAGTAAPHDASGSTKSAGPARRDVSPGHGRLQAGSVPGVASLPPPSLGDLTRGSYMFFPNARAVEMIIDLGRGT